MGGSASTSLPRAAAATAPTSTGRLNAAPLRMAARVPSATAMERLKTPYRGIQVRYNRESQNLFHIAKDPRER
jgi:hypothetical protein